MSSALKGIKDSRSFILSEEILGLNRFVLDILCFIGRVLLFSLMLRNA